MFKTFGVMEKLYLSIKEWADDDQPREKLLKKGVSALSTNELLALILRSGKAGESALDLARRILADCRYDLNMLARLGMRELMKNYKGIGLAKAAGVIAAVELSRRRPLQTEKPVHVIHSSVDAYRYIAPILKDLDHEEFWVIYLNRSNRVIDSEKISSGGMAGTVIDIRILFRKALEVKACAIIVVHNHPSGALWPSEQDKQVTERIQEAGEIVDILLHDHLIIGGGSYFSFVDDEIIDNTLKKTKKIKSCRKKMSD